MTDNNHPITPPPEQLRQWKGMPLSLAFEAAYRAGADQELEACVKWMKTHLHSGPNLSKQLRAARRPKPPSLAEQGLMALEDGDLGPGASLTPVEVCIIRRALERLQRLEQESNDN